MLHVVMLRVSRVIGWWCRCDLCGRGNAKLNLLLGLRWWRSGVLARRRGRDDFSQETQHLLYPWPACLLSVIRGDLKKLWPVTVHAQRRCTALERTSRSKRLLSGKPTIFISWFPVVSRRTAQGFKRGSARKLLESQTYHKWGGPREHLRHLLQSMVQNVQVSCHVVLFVDLEPFVYKRTLGVCHLLGHLRLHQPVKLVSVLFRPGQELDFLSWREDALQGPVSLSESQNHGLCSVVSRLHGQVGSTCCVALQPGFLRLQQCPLEVADSLFLIVRKSYFVTKEWPHGLCGRYAVVSTIKHLCVEVKNIDG